MSQCNYQRRASIEKFSNRPPFDIKKMDDATSTENNKEQNSSFCNNCEKRYVNNTEKSYINVVKYLEHFGDTHSICVNNKNKNIIPKIIESFQKVTPKRNIRKMRCRRKSGSLETLYRNNNPNFGKNLPNHRLMKDLLKNFEDESAELETPKIYQVDMIPSKDISNLSDNLTLRSQKDRVDKNTSTTGLQWPIRQEEEKKFTQSNICLTICNSDKFKSKIPQRKHSKTDDSYTNYPVNRKQVKNKIETKKSSDSSDLEYFPTKENRFQKHEVGSKIPKQTMQVNILNKTVKERERIRCRHNRKDDEYVEKNYTANAKSSEGKIEQRKKEKSFVQLQVEKFNKRNNSAVNRNAQSKGRNSNNLKTKHLQDNNNNNKNTNYMSLLNSVKQTLPQIEKQLVEDTVCESHEHDWSDNQIKPDTQVRFPKETRNAMENLLKNLRRVPLSKFAKNQDLHIQPAIPIRSRPSLEYVECKRAHSGVCHKKIAHSTGPRNMACHNRSSHCGPCSRLDTVPPARFIGRRPSAKGCVK